MSSLKRLFNPQDIGIFTAASGEKALKIIAQKKISLLLSDQWMQGMLGTELVTIVKEIPPQTIRMILTGYSDLDSILEVYRFILKP